VIARGKLPTVTGTIILSRVILGEIDATFRIIASYASMKALAGRRV
jgi:hypothetical protein